MNIKILVNNIAKAINYKDIKNENERTCILNNIQALVKFRLRADSELEIFPIFFLREKNDGTIGVYKNLQYVVNFCIGKNEKIIAIDINSEVNISDIEMLNQRMVNEHFTGAERKKVKSLLTSGKFTWFTLTSDEII